MQCQYDIKLKNHPPGSYEKIMKQITAKQLRKYDMFYDENTLLHFHIGRGGSFNNAGYVTFKGVVDGITCIPAFDSLNSCTDKNGNELDGEWEYTADNGRSVGLTNVEAATGEGAINFDDNYNTHYVCRLGDCGDRELSCMDSLGDEMLIASMVHLELLDADTYVEEEEEEEEE